MMLRYLLSNWVRQTAQQKIREVVTNAAQHRATDGRDGEQDSPAPEPPPAAEVICVFALGAEAGGAVDLLTECVTSRCASFIEYAGYLADRRMAVIETGVGRQLAARATADAIAMHRPSWVISSGFAGALQPNLLRGHIVMPDEVVDLQGGQLSVGLKLEPDSIAETAGLHTGRLLTVDNLIRTTKEKQRLGRSAQRRGL